MGVIGPSQKNLRRWGMLNNSNNIIDNSVKPN